MPNTNKKPYTPGDSWWRDYASSFLNLINPATSIQQGMSANTDRMYPAPAPVVAPVPQRWYHPEEAQHPLYPQGPPADFGGAIIPNPDHLQVLADIQSPADQLTAATMSAENFRGKTPLKKTRKAGNLVPMMTLQ